MFTCRDLTRTFGETTALEDVSLSVERGECAAVIGPSGAGKTTLLHLFARLIDPDAGELTIDGRDYRDWQPGPAFSRRVGIMHQQFDLVDQLPAIHNALAGRLGEWGLVRSLLSLLVPQERSAARRAMRRVGIPDRLYEKTAHLSGGEQQRLALARLLLQKPRGILADEPVASVDPARARDLLKTLLEIAREDDLTLLVSLHSVDLALEFFPHIIALREGRVLFDRTAEAMGSDELETLYELEGVSG